MLCENCKKNTATTHIKRTINGNTQEYHLCSECAKALGMANDFGSFMNFGVGSLFGSLFSDGLAGIEAPAAVKRCPGCGISFDDIARTGLCGCPQCYTTFYDQLLPTLSRIHGKLEHLGKGSKVTEENKRDAQIKSLETQLKQAVDEQRYEDAAKIRDEISALKNPSDVSGKSSHEINNSGSDDKGKDE